MKPAEAVDAKRGPKSCDGHIAVRVSRELGYFEYTYNGEYVRRQANMGDLTAFLTHKEPVDSNLGPKGERVSFDHFAATHYLLKDARRRQNDKTFKREGEAIVALNLFFGQKMLHAIERGDWDEYQSMRLGGKLGRKCSPGGVLKEYKAFRATLNYGVDLKFIRTNPIAGVKPGKLGLYDDNRADIWFTKSELEALLPLLSNQLRDLFEFRMWTGARPEEADRFGQGNINWESGKIWIETIKKQRHQGGAVRKRYLTIKSLGPGLEALLRRVKPHPVTGLLFARPETGAPYCDRYLLTAFQAAVREAGIVKRKLPRPYDLRGTFATHRAMMGISFRQLQIELGHASPISIRNYLDAAADCTEKDSIFFGVDVTAGWKEGV